MPLEVSYLADTDGKDIDIRLLTEVASGIQSQ